LLVVDDGREESEKNALKRGKRIPAAEAGEK
jgi:hypothetical protein